jgi:hypothetical protein
MFSYMSGGDSRYEFRRLLDALPRGTARFTLTGTRADVTLPSSRPEEFVHPTLKPSALDGELSGYQVVVVSAAGAVGKSTMAAELAAQRNMALWNLAKAGSVGQGSLHGMIAQAFGIQNAAAVNTALGAGTFGIVIDALDEGRIRINEAAFEDFIADIGAVAAQLKAPGIILLGRTQIARKARWHLEDAGAKVALVEISHFGAGQRVEYIDKKIRRVNPTSAEYAKSHPRPFAEVRDKIFDLLGQAVATSNSSPGNDEAETFLGYAPVLDAVAVLLASGQNYASLLQEIKDLDTTGDGTKRGPISILRRVVQTIMEREHREKLVPNMKEALAGIAAKHDWSRWDSLYSIEEQSARLLGVALDTPPNKNPTPPMPAEVATAYEEHLQPWLKEHPFLRDGGPEIGNAVFDSFLIAQALVKDVGGMRQAIEARLRDHRYKPNPLMGEFYLDLAKDGPGIHVDHLGSVYDSLLAGLNDDSRMIFEFSGGEFNDEVMDGTAHVEFEFVDADGEVYRQIEHSVAVNAASQLVFTRYLKDATIDTGIDVVLGGGANEYVLGPRVDIECAALSIKAGSLVVTGGRSSGSEEEPEDFGAVLVARSCVSSVTGQPVVRTQLKVTWPGAEAYPWVKFATARLPDHNPQLVEAYRRFRRIVLTLRSHKKGSLARVRDKVESEHVLGDGIGRTVLEKMVEDGVLALNGKFYHWVPDRADALVGVSWLQLHRSDTSEKLLSYLGALVGGPSV